MATTTKHAKHVRAALRTAKKQNPQVNASAPSFEDFLAQLGAAGADDRAGVDMGSDDEDADLPFGTDN